MPEYRSYERGRKFIAFEEAANLAANALGEDLPFRLRLSRWRRLLALLWLVVRLGRKLPDPPPKPTNPHRLWWAGLHLPLSEASGHFAVIGSTGSGKSVTIDSLEQSVLRKFQLGGDQRAFIYDAKREKYSRLMNQKLAVPVHVLDPFDQRGLAWDIAADVTTPADARQVAAALIHGGKTENDRFWLNATRNTLAGVFTVLAELHPKRWTLRDALLVMRSPKRIAYILNLLPETAHLWSEECRDEKTTANLMESFHSFLQQYEIVAALWQNCPRKLSLKEWVKSDSVLLVTGHPRFTEVLKPVHQIVFDLLIDLLLSEPDSRTRASWFFLDEVSELPMLHNLLKAMNLGRSKQIKILLGLQSTESFETVYDTKFKAILGQCRNKAFLRTDSAETAAYMERHFGQVEWLVTKVTYSSNYGGNGGSSYGSSTDHSRRRESVLMASEFMGIKPPSETNPVVLFNDVPSIGSYAVSVPLRDFIERLPSAHPQIPNVLEVPEKCQRFTEWKPADAKRLRLPPELLRVPASQPDLLLAQLKTIQEE